jgi:hypothetical protein
MAPPGYSEQDCAVAYIGPAVVTCLETCCSHPGLPISGPAPSGYSQPGLGGWLRNVSAAGVP